MLLVQRNLTDTVDGIVVIIDHLGHTVLCTLQYHTATEDTREVGTLQRVQETSGIDGTYTILFPVKWIRYPLIFSILNDKIITGILDYRSIIVPEKCQDIISRQDRRLGSS